MAVALPQVIDELTSAGIINSGDMDSLMAALPPETEQACNLLVRKLQMQKKLTDFQAAMVLQGDGKQLLAGEYVMLEQLGKGGMATVYKAKHRGRNQVVALKVLADEVKDQKETSYRFDREVQAAAKVSHPNIVAAFDSFHDRDLHYLVMEFVDGPNLSQLLKKSGPVTYKEALNYTYQVARGLEHAHGRRIVHRDIKPDNLLLDPFGTIKILDMGLARFDNAPPVDRHPDSLERLTQMGTMLGTADFMSPEQSVDPRQADYRSDIYSLGCTMYFLLTGKGPYSKDTTMATLMAHSTEKIPQIQSVRPEVPQEVQAVFAKMVAKNPRDRYQEMSEVIADIVRILPELGGGASVLDAAATVKTQTGSSTVVATGTISQAGSPYEQRQALPRRTLAMRFITIFFGCTVGAFIGVSLALAQMPFVTTVMELLSRFNNPFLAEPSAGMAVTGAVLGGLIALVVGELLG